MIFALYDYYFQYKKRKGLYSLENLNKKYGMQLCTLKNFPNLAATPALSALFYHGYPSLLSWAVMYITDSQISHMAIFKKNGFIHDTLKDAGITEVSWQDYIDNQSCMVIVPLTAEQFTSVAMQELGFISFLMALLSKKKDPTVDELLEQMNKRENENLKYGTFKSIRMGIAILFGVGKFKWRLFADSAVVWLGLHFLLNLWFSSNFFLYVMAFQLLHILIFLNYRLTKPTPEDVWKRSIDAQLPTPTTDELEKQMIEKMNEQKRSWWQSRIQKSKW